MNFSWSFSSLNNYRTCPKRYYHYNVRKDVKEPENENMRWGFQVHDAMAKRIIRSTPLPSTMPYEKWIDWALTNTDRTVTTIKAESKAAITENWEPCEFFDRIKPVWFRTVLDVVKVRPMPEGGKAARIIDWKTGRKPGEDDDKEQAKAMQQLETSATAMFIHDPDITVVRVQLAYLQDGDPPTEKDWTQRDIQRTDLPKIWGRILPELNEMKRSIATTDFPTNPTGLCKRHCAVTSCPYHGKGRY